MANKFRLELQGLRQLEDAIRRSPRTIERESGNFIARGIARYQRTINNDPWRVDGTGGGVPVSNDPRYTRKYQRQKSGNLRDAHRKIVTPFFGRIYPDQQQAPYAWYVHDGTRYMQARPWLDYAKKRNERNIERLFRGMLRNIAKDLSR